MFRRSIRGKRVSQIPSFRKLAVGAWRSMNDAATTAELTLNMEPVLTFLDNLNSKEKGTVSGSQDGHSSNEENPITLTHFWVKAIAQCLEKFPEVNTALVGSKFILRDHIDIFVTTMIREKGTHNHNYDLSGISIQDPHKMNLKQIANESYTKIEDLKKGRDTQIRRVRKLSKWIPLWAAPVCVGLANWWTFTLNRSLEWLGLPGDRFGSVLISNFAALGVEKATIPLYPFSRTPYAVGLGKPRLTPIAEGNSVTVKTCSTITFTMDHRVIDGFQGAKLMKHLRKIVNDPQALLS